MPYAENGRWLLFDLNDPANVPDSITSRLPVVWTGSDWQINVGVVSGGSMIDASLITSMTLTVKAAEDKQGDAIEINSVAANLINNTVLQSEFDGRTKAHCSFDFSSVDTDISIKGRVLRKLHAVLSYLTTGGDTIVVGVTELQMKNSGLPGIISGGVEQGGNILPSDAVYDGSGDYPVTVVAGRLYGWSKGENDTSVDNDGQVVTVDGNLDTVTTLITLKGTASQPVTARLRSVVYLSAAEADSRYGDGNAFDDVIAGLGVETGPVADGDTILVALAKINSIGLDHTSPVTVGVGSSLGTLTVYGNDAASSAMVIQTAADQTADAFRIQDSAGTELVSIGASGNIAGARLLGGGIKSTTGYVYTDLVLGSNDNPTASQSSGATFRAGYSGQNGLYFADSNTGDGRYAGYILYDHSTDYMAFGSGNGVESMRIDSSSNVIINGTTSLGTTTIYGHDTAASAMVVQSAADQIADIFQIQDSAGAVHAAFGAVVSGASYLTLGDGSTDIGSAGSYITYKTEWGDITQSAWGGMMKFGGAGFGTLGVTGEFHAKTKIGWSLSQNTVTQIELEKVADAHLALTGGDVSDVCQFTVGARTSLGTTTIYGHDAAASAMVIQTVADQTADAFVIQDSAAAEVFSVGNTGIVTAYSILGSNPTLAVKGTTSVYLQAGAATLMGVFSTSVWMFSNIHSDTDGARDCGTALKKWGNVWTDKITVNGTTSLAELTVYGTVAVTGDTINLATEKTPASASATGTKGDICWDAGYVYVCVAADEWERAAIATW